MYGSDLKMFQRKVSGLLFVSSHCLLTHVDLVRVERDAVAVQPVQVPRLGQQVESEQCSVMIEVGERIPFYRRQIVSENFGRRNSLLYCA